MQKIGIIDLGSNSTRLMVMGLNDDGSYKLIDESKETVRLSEKMGQNLLLHPLAMERTVKALKLFQYLCKVHSVTEVIAVATAAVRQAKNSQEFLNRVTLETGFNIRVLDGIEEAKTVFKGVVNSIVISDGIVFDIGGGSTEIVLFKDRKIVEAVSLPFGAVTLTERFFSNSKNNDHEMEKLVTFLKNQLNIPWLRPDGNFKLIGLGGTVRNLAKIDRKRSNYRLDMTHYYQLQRNNVDTIFKELSSLPLEQRKKTPGLSKERADIIVAGLAIVQVIMQTTATEELIVSGAGLREGIFFDNYLKRFNLQQIDDVLEHNVINILKNYHANISHANHVAKLSLSLFDQIVSLHLYGANERKILKAAAMLHDIGIAVNYYDHYKHSFYLITNSRLNGLNHRELILTAYLAASHAKPVKVDSLPYSFALSDEDSALVKKLGMLIRIAESLDRSESTLITDVQSNISDNLVSITLNSKENVDLEINNVYRYRNEFRKIFNRDLVIRAISS